MNGKSCLINLMIYDKVTSLVDELEKGMLSLYSRERGTSINKIKVFQAEHKLIKRPSTCVL